MAKVYNLLETHEKTHGERRVEALLSQLPNTKFIAFAEPRIKVDGKSHKPDFVIVARELGVIIVEIKDWLEIIEADSNRVKIRRRDSTTLTLPNPVNQVEQVAYDMKALFEQHADLMHRFRGKLGLKFPWQIMVILPNIDDRIIKRIVDGGIWQNNIVVGKSALSSKKRFEDTLRKLPWVFKMKSPINEQIADVINSILNPRIQMDNDIESNTIAERRIQTEIIEEPLEQQRLLIEDENTGDAPFSVRLVRGVAGSGKTLVLTRRVRYLHEQYPDLNISVITFNKHLAQDLKRRIENPQVEVVHFHKLCAKIIGDGWAKPHQVEKWLKKHMKSEIADAGFTVDFVADEIQWRKDLSLFDNQAYLEIDRKGRGTGLTADRRQKINTIFDAYRAFQGTGVQNLHQMTNADWEDVPHFASQALASAQHPMHKQYDVVLIDEAQDFAPSWLEVLKLLLADGGHLFLCDDPTQSLFRYFTWKEKGIDVRNRSKRLRIPLRGSREITEAAFSIINADERISDNPDIIKPRYNYVPPSGIIPRLMGCYDDDVEQQSVTQMIEDWIGQGVQPREIGILCHESKVMRQWKEWQEEGCYVGTFRQMKGLEFRAVILPSLHTLFPSEEIENTAELTHIRQRLYTAMTRATRFLGMFYQGELPQYLKSLLDHVWHDEV